MKKLSNKEPLSSIRMVVKFDKTLSTKPLQSGAYICDWVGDDANIHHRKYGSRRRVKSSPF